VVKGLQAGGPAERTGQIRVGDVLERVDGRLVQGLRCGPGPVVGGEARHRTACGGAAMPWFGY
jgi:C-terminal processing protease CtpA/Prc